MNTTLTRDSIETLVAELAEEHGIRHWNASDVTPTLAAATRDWLETYRGDFSFLVDMKAQVFLQGLSLSPRQTAGVLNCIMAEVKRKAARGQAPKGADREVVTGPTEGVPNGTYTVVWPEGGHTTIRIRAWKRTGERVAAYLMGSDNEGDYQGFATVRAGGYALWKTYAADGRPAQALSVLLTGGHATAGEAYALASGNCWRCGRTLTVPASLARGLGPECATKV